MGSALDQVVARMAEATSSFLQPSYLQEGFAAVPDDMLAALVAERAAGSVYREGWETFGVVHLTRQSDPLNGPDSRPLDRPVDWPASEVHGGVFNVTVQSHGDDPDGAYVKVVGPDRAAVEGCFARTANVVRSLLGTVWSDTGQVFVTVNASDVQALRPLFETLIQEHTLLVVLDELVGTARLDGVIDALVHLLGWGDLVTAVVTCKPRTRPLDPIPEPF